MRFDLNYYIYDIDKPGIREFDHLDEAMKEFINTPLESRYSAIGISKPSRAVDIIIKEKIDRIVGLRLSKDFLYSSIYKDNREETISEIKKMNKALRFSNRVLDKILETEILSDESLNDELEL